MLVPRVGQLGHGAVAADRDIRANLGSLAGRSSRRLKAGLILAGSSGAVS